MFLILVENFSRRFAGGELRNCRVFNNVNTQRYTPFGEVRTNGNLTTDHTYTGQVFDQGTGLGFYNARYYDPATGRFITPDSIVPNPQDGQDYNRYTYVRNNPIKYSDPSGHDYCLGGGGGCGGVRGPGQGEYNPNTGRRDALDANGDGIVCGGGLTAACESSWQGGRTPTPALPLQNFQEEVDELIRSILAGETPIGSVGACGELEGTLFGPSGQQQGCLMFETGTRDMYGTYGAGGGIGGAVEGGLTGGIIISSSGAPGTWPDFNTSVCGDASAGGSAGGGVAVCFGVTSNNQLDFGSYAIEIFGGAVVGGAVSGTVQGSVAFNLPDLQSGPDVEDALVALETAYG